MMIILGMMFILSVQPMMVMSSLILMVLFYSMFLYWNVGSFWYSYMIILVMMSGIFVVFTYMMSILPNESFEISSLVMMVLGMIFLTKFTSSVEFTLDESVGSMKLWIDLTWVLSMFLVIYLLMMMILVVWFSQMEKGAVRIS